ncbi:hypothetical protein JR316_0003534 [Psilocybe cubensis]|uniref:Polysaccharide lyase 14 domain-containing protein n=2 Tax=Psilocybe cubensis TaxID=181762 RepID=A0A8H7Y4S7_PSICU|nr:hypothetical protein JR316_0003534 [Psilocybe cubensis]KAH9484054.1 hypothetical protein JR316_0003534 [Psilocybe cubensis]
MFSSRVINVIVLLTLLVVLSDARPVRRRTCRAPSSAAQLSATPSPSATVSPSQVVSESSASQAASTSPIVIPSSSSVPLSSKAPTSTSSVPATSPTGVLGGMLNRLFPVSGFSKSWTTSPLSGQALALSDAAFRPTNVLTSVPHTYVNAPDGKRAMKAHYPKGSYTFGFNPQGGFSFYAPGHESVDLTTAKEATFGYSVYFPAGFNFQLGGKLPGLYGGNSAEESINCSGGSRSSACFSARLMWRSEGRGEFYTYLPPYTEPQFAANKAVCNVAPQSDCNPVYGASVGRGSFEFATGAWTTISERVRLNDVGQANGELQLFVNGKSVINVGGLILRDSAAGRIRGMQMQTFFGGSKIEFASPKDQDVFFSDFSVAITKAL